MRRKHSVIDTLPPEVKETVEEMIKANFTYKEISEYIQTSSDIPVSISSVWRYAKGFNESIQALRMAQQNMKLISDELSKNPNIDTTEGIITLLSNYMLEALSKAPEEYWQSMPPEDFIKHSTALVRAAAYKRNLDIKNKDITDIGLEQVKELVFSAMATEKPELYAEVVKYLNGKEGQI